MKQRPDITMAVDLEVKHQFKQSIFESSVIDGIRICVFHIYDYGGVSKVYILNVLIKIKANQRKDAKMKKK